MLFPIHSSVGPKNIANLHNDYHIKVFDNAIYSSCSLYLDAVGYYPIAFKDNNNNSRTS